jgi:hypothetical protein
VRFESPFDFTNNALLYLPAGQYTVVTSHPGYDDVSWHGPLPGADPAAEGSAHLDGRDRRQVDPRSFASVVAHRCAVADALTKVVLAEGVGASGILARYGARAYLHHPDRGWQDVGGST